MRSSRLPLTLGLVTLVAFLLNALSLLALLTSAALFVLALVAWTPGLGAKVLARLGFPGLPLIGRATGLAASAVLLAGSLAALLVAGAIAPPVERELPGATPAAATGPAAARPTTTEPGAGPAASATAPLAAPSATAGPGPTPSGQLVVHFIDVGQGDATLLQGPDFVILIDTGTHTGDEVVPYLRSVGVSSIDLLIGTHPHADHIGQFPQVLAAFAVREVWLSGDPHTTLTFERALDAIARSDAGYHEPRTGETLAIGSARLEVVNPARLTGELHEGSISVRIIYGQVAFLFTGDAEAATERAMVTRGRDLSAQVLQLGHHGSRTSSTAEFLRAVGPRLAVWSAGARNQYGHPHPETLARLAEMGIATYGTAINGTVRVRTDGREITVEVSRGELSRVPDAHTAAPTPAGTAEMAPSPAGSPISAPATSGCRSEQVDINAAPIAELERIIHIGPARAQEMIGLRPFRSVDDMIRISGIGSARLADIKAQGLACVR